MVGQGQLISLIDTLSLDSFPKTLILIGERGGGKHMLVEYIGIHLGIQIIDITSTISQETIDQINGQPFPYLYYISANQISIKEQNMLLKLLEEPLKNSYIVLMCETQAQIIPTVLNRGIIWTLNTYSEEDLKQFMVNKSEEMQRSLVKYCRTPGQIISLCNMPDDTIVNMKTLATNILTNISRANIPNILTISNKLSFKSESDLYPIDIFVQMLLIDSRDMMIQNCDKACSIYKLTDKLANHLLVNNIQKRHIFEHYLLELKLLLSEN